ncbi:MAG: tripartite tricarboxylate transporter permease [Candidatus Woesearchaeota archaeon]
MIWQILLAIFLGVNAGIITGLIPGIHINLVSVLLVSASGYFIGLDPILIGVFIVAMSVTHTFLDSIPSTFLGAPDADMALNVLPAHRMLIKGQGYEAVKLTVVGSLLSLIAVVCLIPIMIQIAPGIYEFLQPFIGWILLVVVIYIIMIESGIDKKILGLFVFLLSGFLGIIVLGIPNMNQPLFAMLSGLFGVSTLVISLKNKNKIPEQRFDKEIKVGKKKTAKAISAAVFSGSLTGLFPGLGSAQAAIIGMQLVGKIGMHGFMILIGGINTVNLWFY